METVQSASPSAKYCTYPIGLYRKDIQSVPREIGCSALNEIGIPCYGQIKLAIILVLVVTFLRR